MNRRILLALMTIRLPKLRGHLLGESDRSSSTPLHDSSLYDGEAGNGFWSISGNFVYRHHVDPRVKLHVSREASFPIPLRYVDVTRAANTPLDVLLEKNIGDCGNVDGDRELSDTWTGLTRFTVLFEKTLDGYTWSGRRLTRNQTTSRPDTLWPEIWKEMSDASKRKEKEKWAVEENCVIFH